MAQYSKGAGKKVADAMHEMKEGKLTSGRSGKKVTSRQQAIAIGLSEAKEGGEKVPAKKGAAKKSASKTGAKSAAKKGASKRGLASASTATKKAVARKGGSASNKSSR